MYSFCCGLVLFAGLEAHSNSFDDSRWQAENPIGTVRLEYNRQVLDPVHLRLYAEHRSTIGVMDTPGFNAGGVGFYWLFK